MINYIFYTLITTGSAYLVYLLVLKKQKTFQFNRFYLIGSLLLCLLAPMMELTIFDAVPSITEITLNPSPERFKSELVIEGTTVKEIESSSYWFLRMSWYVYLLISSALLLRFVVNLFQVVKQTRQSHAQLGSFNLVEIDSHEHTSSFFNYLFINPEILNNEAYSDSVIQHELVHSKQWHTLDVIVLELLLCALWFNPFVWLYKRAIVQNHEFIADSNTIRSGIDIENYSRIIINSNLKEHRVPLTSGFNFIQIKNRIIMLHQSKSSVLNRTLRMATALLLFFGIFMLGSFKNLNEPLVVVVDAAHGGKDAGNLNEKAVVLNISKALSQLSDDNIKIITLRDEDRFLSLNERVAFINQQQPDLMISLHCNSAQNTAANGVEVYYSEKHKRGKLSFGYGWLLMDQQLKNNITNKGDMKTANFYLLKEVQCPAVLMELGFLSNGNDYKRLNDAAHQNDIAKALYDGLLEIKDKKELIAALDKE